MPGQNFALSAALAAVAALIELWPGSQWRACAAEYRDGLTQTGLGRLDATMSALDLIRAAVLIRLRVWLLRPRMLHVVLHGVIACVALVSAVGWESHITGVPVPKDVIVWFISLTLGPLLGERVARLITTDQWQVRLIVGLLVLYLSIAYVPAFALELYASNWDDPYMATWCAAIALSQLLAVFVGYRWAWCKAVCPTRRTGEPERKDAR
ncbi:hypothetical protein [Krasilnikovia sp. M28-CT-15]|uniref:hypothetical protein n=1 Tax=Krasilnikovia sp. M28-CT-15 TaxID=3373540 RepID=UPI0038760AE2